ncbi:hypothetical protein Sa4125_09460 [Aureimonas sp. SA4125]|uniref:hypothetical protein n=1 Tax=Aureimonas sp. SA4125 TaxID=2826993 RepID=UPI001CC4951D|nr:hypothetical protein [Aureimonas sp. SA4125]BDA83404.1 hypothetical protein Sa4125_09460 [Aureimonas sp. SA4125]
MTPCLPSRLVAFALAGLAPLAALPPVMAEDGDVPPAHYPELVSSAQTVAGFVPGGWRLESEAHGDLDKDGRSDVVFVLHGTDPAKIVEAGWSSEPMDSNPRILAAALANPEGGYRLVLDNHTLIPRREQWNIDDAFDDGLALARGAFSVSLSFFASAGSWEMHHSKATFRWRKDRFELIGFDRNSIMRNSGEIRQVSANYATGRMEIATGKADSDEMTLTTRDFPARRLTVEAVGNGLDFDPEAQPL